VINPISLIPPSTLSQISASGRSKSSSTAVISSGVRTDLKHSSQVFGVGVGDGEGNGEGDVVDGVNSGKLLLWSVNPSASLSLPISSWPSLVCVQVSFPL
jgi:hypothetical protein